MTPENAIFTLRRQAQTSKRAEALRERRAASGLKRLELYLHPEDHDIVKALAAALMSKRQSPTKL